jgi:hypothetical protein
LYYYVSARVTDREEEYNGDDAPFLTPPKEARLSITTTAAAKKEVQQQTMTRSAGVVDGSVWWKGTSLSFKEWCAMSIVDQL